MKTKKKNPPKGYDYLEPILLALENELRDKVRESNANKRNMESMWPVHQIQNQRTRYVYDMHYKYKKISRKVLDYCVKNKQADAALMAKWKKPGYERLCSTYVINSSNYKFGTTSICRVPLYQRRDELKFAQDPTTGCLGCASGGRKGAPAGPKNIFGNKYGQRLAAIQIAREERMKELEAKKEERRRLQEDIKEAEDEDNDGSSSSDDDDFGPSPAAGVWAKNQSKLEEQTAFSFGDDDDDDDEVETDDEEDEGPQPSTETVTPAGEECYRNDENDERPHKKVRAS